MKNIIYLISLSCGFFSCAVSTKIHKEDIAMRFLDEQILPNDLVYKNTKVGGLSGIDYQNDKWFLICDDSSNPRIYTADLIISENEIKSISITDYIEIQKNTNNVKNHFLDLEAIRLNPETDTFLVSSEGKISDRKDPGIFEISKTGNVIKSFGIPANFKSTIKKGPRNNGVFEGLSLNSDNKGFWVASELPLYKDGAKAKIFPSRAQVRITYYDTQNPVAQKQFVYKLDGIAKLPINYFAVNGVTEILEYERDKFLILERSYSAGYGSHGNTVKIFNVDASQATNTLKFDKLKGANYKKAKKQLIFNFKSVKNKLTEKIIDNIEGMTFGPILPNGKQSLILVSDNNFNSFGKQLNQFILMEINFKN